MAAELIGTWRADHELLADGHPRSLAPEEMDELVFRPDGTAQWRFLHPRSFPDVPDPGPSPFPETWEVRQPGTVSVWIPIAPMPEYGLDGWTREERRYTIVTRSGDTLTLRPCDNEIVVVFRRVHDSA